MIARRASPPQGKLDSVQALRAVAVLIVAAYHLTILFRDPLAARRAVPDALYFGYAGVDLFFVISGFIIMHVTSRPGIDVREFLLKRAFRILPLYWATTTLIVIIWWVRPGLVPIRGGDAARFLLDSYLLIPTRERPLLGVGWTLQHEFQFYLLVAGLLVLGARRWTAAILLAIFAAAVGLRVGIDPALRLWDAKLASLYSLEFALGVIAYRINARWRVSAGWPLIALGVAGFVATAAVVTSLMPDDREVQVVAAGAFGLLRTLGYGVSSFAILLGALNVGGDPGEVRWPRALIVIGDASFSIYLTHNLVLQALALGTRRLPLAPASAVVMVVVALVVVAAAGWIMHRAIEKPLIRVLEKHVIPALIGHRPAQLTLAAGSEGG